MQPRVTFITGSLPPIKCGVGYYSNKLLQALSAGGLKNITVISSQGVSVDSSYPILTVPNWKLRSLRKLVKTVSGTSPQIVHIQYPAVGYRRQLGINLLPYFLKRRLSNATLVISLHEYHASRWIGKLRNLLTLLPAHKIIVSNEADKQALPSRFQKRVVIIPIASTITKTPRNTSVYKKILEETGL